MPTCIHVKQPHAVLKDKCGNSVLEFCIGSDIEQTKLPLAIVPSSPYASIPTDVDRAVTVRALPRCAQKQKDAKHASAIRQA